ncbi:Hachiman antiphage defense system protein HamA, partial [Acinetobacter baumannii]
DICNAIAYEFYQIFMPKGGNINFLPSQAAFLIYKHNKLDPINKLLSARVAESYLNAPHLYSTSLNDSLYHHAHYLFINDGSDLAISIYCGHNLLETNIRMNIEKIILNANSYQFDQNLLMERSFLDQNLDQEVCDKIFDLLFSYQGRISNFCLVFTVSMELFHESEFEDVKDYIENLIENSCNNIDSTILKKLKSGLNLHVIVIPINVENEITEKFLKDLTGES